MEDDLMESVSKMKEWKEVAEGGTFFGKPISEMTEDELLGTIGYFVKEQESRENEIQKERSFMSGIDTAQRNVPTPPVIMPAFGMFGMFGMS